MRGHALVERIGHFTSASEEITVETLFLKSSFLRRKFKKGGNYCCEDFNPVVPEAIRSHTWWSWIKGRVSITDLESRTSYMQR